MVDEEKLARWVVRKARKMYGKQDSLTVAQLNIALCKASDWKYSITATKPIMEAAGWREEVFDGIIYWVPD